MAGRPRLRAALLICSLASVPALSLAGAAPVRLAPLAEPDFRKPFDGNRIRCTVSNVGALGREPEGVGPGMEWPQGSGRTLFSGAGLWLAGRIQLATTCAIADYFTEFMPGPAPGASGQYPGNDSDFYVYKIARQDLVSPGSDYLRWPVLVQGAPTAPDGTPKLRGEQTLYCIFTDSEPRLHSAPNGGTLPFGVEVHQMVYGFNRPFTLGDAMIVEYDFVNMSRYRWAEFYVGLWSDPDIGVTNNDLAGFDSVRALAYAYDAPFPPGHEGEPEPAVGVMLLAENLPGRPKPGVHAFAGYPPELDPPSADATLRMARGFRPDGSSWTCGGAPTRYPFSGDPVTGQGCVDPGPGNDKRLLLSIGPYDVNPGAVIHIAMAYLVGKAAAARTPVDNVIALRQTADALRAAWADSFLDVPPVPASVTSAAALPNPFRDVTEIEFTVPDGAVIRELVVFDARGRLIWKEPTPYAPSGYARLRWGGQTLSGESAPSGSYVMRVLTDRGTIASRVVRLR